MRTATAIRMNQDSNLDSFRVICFAVFGSFNKAYHVFSILEIEIIIPQFTNGDLTISKTSQLNVIFFAVQIYILKYPVICETVATNRTDRASFSLLLWRSTWVKQQKVGY